MQRGCVIIISLLLQLFGTAAEGWEQQPTENGTWYLGVSNYGSKLTRECSANLAVFVPKQPTTTVIVYFHGFRDTIGKIMKSADYRLGDRQAIVVVPQGPCNARVLEWEKQVLNNLFTLITEALQQAQNKPKKYRLILSAHSGGYWAAQHALSSRILNPNETWLFDALYGGPKQFLAWHKEAPSTHVIRAVCTRHQHDRCTELKKLIIGASSLIVAEQDRRPGHNGIVGKFMSLWLQGEQLASAGYTSQ